MSIITGIVIYAFGVISGIAVCIVSVALLCSIGGRKKSPTKEEWRGMD